MAWLSNSRERCNVVFLIASFTILSGWVDVSGRTPELQCKAQAWSKPQVTLNADPCPILLREWCFSVWGGDITAAES